MDAVGFYPYLLSYKSIIDHGCLDIRCWQSIHHEIYSNINKLVTTISVLSVFKKLINRKKKNVVFKCKFDC